MVSTVTARAALGGVAGRVAGGHGRGDVALGQPRDRLPGAVAPASAVASPPANATVTADPASALPANLTALRARSAWGFGAATASLGATVSTSKLQLRRTVRAKTLSLEKLTSTSWAPRPASRPA